MPGLEVRVPVKAGTREVGVSFVRKHREPEGILQPPQRGFARTTNELYYGEPAVDTVLIGGPYRGAVAVDTPSRRKVFVCRPTRQRFRRAVREEDSLDARPPRLSAARDRARRSRRCSGSTRPGRSEGGFDAGIQRGLRRILAAPSFLFRVEREPANVAAGHALSPQRRRPRVAAVVLSVEQHSRR